MIEVMVALLMVMLAAVLLARVSGSNAATQAQARKHAVAVRLASEFAEWTRRGGHIQLGTPLPQALAMASSLHRSAACPEQGCDAGQAAWRYLTDWQQRVQGTLPQAAVLVCADQWPSASAARWACAAGGSALVLKIRTHKDAQPVAVALGSSE